MVSTLVHHMDILWGLDISTKFVVSSCSEDKSVALYLHSDIFLDISKSDQNLSIIGKYLNQ